MSKTGTWKIVTWKIATWKIATWKTATWKTATWKTATWCREHMSYHRPHSMSSYTSGRRYIGRSPDIAHNL